MSVCVCDLKDERLSLCSWRPSGQTLSETLFLSIALDFKAVLLVSMQLVDVSQICMVCVEQNIQKG